LPVEVGAAIVRNRGSPFHRDHVRQSGGQFPSTMVTDFQWNRLCLYNLSFRHISDKRMIRRRKRNCLLEYIIAVQHGKSSYHSNPVKTHFRTLAAKCRAIFLPMPRFAANGDIPSRINDGWYHQGLVFDVGHV